MPKCGGTSFRELLRTHYKLRYAKDYDYPLHQTFKQRTQEAESARKWIRIKHKYLFQYRFTRCIHGHFLPYKYDYFYGRDGTAFITWMRDPIERLVSHYYYWQRSYQNINHPKYLQKKVIEEEWTLKEFALSEELRNIYAKFLWNFPVEQFDFIGITEYFEQDYQYFAQHYLGRDDVSVPKKNIGSEHSKPYFNDNGLVRDIKSYHARDYEIYRFALKARKLRQKTY